MNEATKLHLILLRVEIALSKLHDKIDNDLAYSASGNVSTDLDAAIQAIRDNVQCDAPYSGERTVMEIKELDQCLATQLSLNTLI